MFRGVKILSFSLYAFFKDKMAINIKSSIKVIMNNFVVKKIRIKKFTPFLGKKKAGSEDPALIKLI